MARNACRKVLITCAILACASLLTMPDFLIHRDLRNWWYAKRLRSECATNLRSLRMACDVYATDNDGHYPASLQHLVPSVLRTLPTCPTVGTFAYTTTQPIDIWPGYTITCTGDHRGRSVQCYVTQTMVCQ